MVSASAPAFFVWHDGETVPAGARGAIVALGNFDGVHLGHQALVAATVARARRGGRPAAVLTFEPHPRRFFKPDAPLFRLTPKPAKVRILSKLRLDGVLVRRFDAALAALTAQAFVEDVLVGELGVAGVVIGHDFCFGRGREGTPRLMAQLCAERGLSCTVIRSVERGGAPVSSSAIRRALESGSIRNANASLGYRWFVEGEVRHGAKRGRTLGFPTANLQLDQDCSLRHGIFAMRLAIGSGEVRQGVASFGRRPTFDGGAPLLEAFLFDFDGDLYGRTIRAEFVDWIRSEESFESAEALIERMNEDARQAKNILNRASRDGVPSMID